MTPFTVVHENDTLGIGVSEVVEIYIQHMRVFAYVLDLFGNLRFLATAGDGPQGRMLTGPDGSVLHPDDEDAWEWVKDQVTSDVGVKGQPILFWLDGEERVSTVDMLIAGSKTGPRWYILSHRPDLDPNGGSKGHIIAKENYFPIDELPPGAGWDFREERWQPPRE